MAQKLIRNIPDKVMDAVEQKAQASGKNAEEWIRDLLIRVTSEPIVRERYAYRFIGPGEARGKISRISNHVNGIGGGYDNLSGEQADAVKNAQDYVRRNDPGDQLRAYEVLKAHFEEVFEVPV